MTTTSSIGWFFNSKKLATTPLLIVSVLMDFMLLVMGHLFFGSYWNGYENIVFIYMIVTFGLLVVSQWNETQITYMGAITLFLPAFFITGIVVGSLNNTSFLISNGIDYVVMQLILQIFVVSLSEEIIFRGILLQSQYSIGVIPQAILFALFHWAAYSNQLGQTSYLAIFETLILGLILGYIIKYTPKKYDSIAITWGIHAGWNVAIITGIFSALFITGASTNFLLSLVV
jgi:membrane protease YdiL (CAAX protease family)